MIEKQPCDPRVTTMGSRHQRRNLFHVLQIDVGSLVDQQLRHFRVALAREDHEGRVTGTVARVWRGTFVQYATYGREIVIARRNKQLRVEAQFWSCLGIGISGPRE